MTSKPPTLRRELIAALALVFLGALLVAAIGLVIMVPKLKTAEQTLIYLALLVGSDVLVFLLFGRYLLQHRLLRPLDAMVAGAEQVAAGDYQTRLPDADTEELRRLSEAVNHMAETLIHHQSALAANVQSLQETNIELTEARDAVVRVEKMASVGRLAAGIAHEVGNPLGAILGYLGLISRRADDSGRELVQAAENEAKRIDRIVRGLLDYARVRESKPLPIDVNSVVDQTLELVRTQGKFSRVEVSENLDRAIPLVIADPYQLQQVLVNLLVNAVDATGERKDPRVDVRSSVYVHRRKSRTPIRRKDDPEGIDYSHRRRLAAVGRIPREDPFNTGVEVVEIRVTDNGSGIPKNMLEQIFEPFVTTKEPGQGTGLGLAVCARLIDGMGGTIRAESAEGAGATFVVQLPAEGQENISETSGSMRAIDPSMVGS